MELLRTVSDIASDPLTKKLDELGNDLGVLTMKQAFDLIKPYMKKDGQKAPFYITQDNCFEMIRFFYSMAVFSHACSIHEQFSIPTDDEEIAQILSRSYTIEQHQATFQQHLNQTLRLIEKYGLPEFIARG